MRQFSVDYALALQHQFNAGPVDAAYRKVNDRWKESQVEISGGIDNIADVLKSIREAFQQVETDLTNALVAGGPPATS